MSWFRRRPEYDRSTLLDAAARARSRKKRPRAIELYRRVLAVEPHNPELHAKLAPLLAETGQGFDSWQSFRAVARAHLREGHADQALAVYHEAALYLPQEIQAWQAVARLQHRSGRQREASETLLEGSRNFRTRWLRPQAIALLRRARDIDAWDFEIVLELARLLASDDQGIEAAMLLKGLVERTRGRRLRRVRGAQLRNRPRFATLWRWLRAALQRRDAGAESLPSDEPQRRPVTKPNAIVQLHTARNR
jgi:tetratricopeptide (TPR) repeat protein